MKTIENAYAEFRKIILEGGVKCSRDFRQICRSIGVSPSDLNEILESELGADGFEIAAQRH